VSAVALRMAVEAAGGRLRADGAELVVVAPKGRLGPELVAELRERKRQVLALLAGGMLPLLRRGDRVAPAGRGHVRGRDGGARRLLRGVRSRAAPGSRPARRRESRRAHRRGRADAARRVATMTTACAASHAKWARATQDDMEACADALTEIRPLIPTLHGTAGVLSSHNRQRRREQQDRLCEDAALLADLRRQGQIPCSSIARLPDYRHSDRHQTAQPFRDGV
jgi:hypothetical protein